MPRTVVMSLAAAIAAAAVPAAASAASSTSSPKPVALRVLSPSAGAVSGRVGVGSVVDLSLRARRRLDNARLGAAAGYSPFFNAPTAPTFKPGPAPGAKGLVVMLSTTPTMPGTPFQGPRTNLAGLFQTTGTSTSRNGLRRATATWFPAKALFGVGRRTTLTAYVVRGTAPAVVPHSVPKRLSNTTKVRFVIGG